MDWQLGANAKLYVGASGAAMGAMAEVAQAREVTVSSETGEVDLGRRAAGGYKSTGVGQTDYSIEFDLLYKSDDAQFQTIRNAYNSKTALEMAALTAAEGDGGEGPKGAFYITSFVRNEPLEEGITYSVTAKLYTFSEYVGD